MGHLAGYARSASFDGISFSPIADNAVTIQNVRNTRQRKLTYGGSYEQVGVQECYIGNLVLEVDNDEYAVLKSLHDDLSKPIKGSITLADASQYKGEGTFAEFGELDTMEGTVTLKFSAVTEFDVF